MQLGLILITYFVYQVEEIKIKISKHIKVVLDSEHWQSALFQILPL